MTERASDNASLDHAFLARCRDLVGAAHVLTGSDAAPYLTDWRGRFTGRTRAVVSPASSAEVAAVVRLCAQYRVPLVPQGGRTGLVLGSVPDASGDAIVLSLRRLNRVRAIDTFNRTMTVDAGCILHDIQQAAAGQGMLFPLSLAAEGSCTIGGNLATNAGGIAVLRYGNTRDLVLGIEAVLPDGRIWNGLRALRKDNTGYDLRHLFIGSEGTLGVITAAVLKLYPKPVARATAWVGAARLDDLVDLLAHMRSVCGERLVAFEMLSRDSLALVMAQVSDVRPPLAGEHAFHALIELADTQPQGLGELLEAGLGQALESGLAQDVAMSVSGQQTSAFWKIREGISQAQVRAGKAVKHDLALPISSLSAFVARADVALRAVMPDVQIINFGHLGDGNLHYNVLLPMTVSYPDMAAQTAILNRIVHDLVAEFDGSISAEHGIGQLRRDEMRHYKSALEFELMMRVKQSFDPNHIMNPGKLL